VTEQKLLEEEVNSYRKRLQSIVNQSPIGIIDWNLDFKVKMWNSAAENIFGHTKEEALGQHASFIIPETDKNHVNKVWRALLKNVGGTHSTNLNVDKNGKIIRCKWYNTPLVNNKGETIGVVSMVEDITENIRVQQELVDSNNKLSVIYNSAPDGIFLHDVKGNFIDGNKAAEKLLGYKKEQLIGKNFFKLDLLNKNEVPKAVKMLSKVAIGKKIEPTLFILNRKDGSKIPVEISSYQTSIKNKKVILGVARDISKRLEVEQALIKSEKRYHKFFMEDLTGDYLSTRDGKIIDCNKKFLEIFGFRTIQQAKSVKAETLYRSKTTRNTFVKILEQKKSLKDYQTEAYKADGKKIIIRENVVGEFDDSGQLIRIRGYIYDVTDRIKAERAVKKLSTVVEQSPLHIMITDYEGNIEYVNPAFAKVTGYSPDEVIGKNPSILKSGETPLEIYQNLWDTLLSGYSWTGEFLNSKKDGTKFWQRAVISPIKDTKDTITNFVAILHDVTKEKYMLDKLRDREEKYRTLTQNLNVGIYRTTPGPNGRFIEVNPALCRILGLKSKSDANYYKIRDFYSDINKRDEFEIKLQKNGFLLNEQVELRTIEGKKFVASISATVQKNRDDEPIYYDGIIEDITEKKKTEQQQ
jgi:PAS domain S-box-containing protein